ncbi:MAG TPA: YncE family protein [Vicinamibacteria bacterium]|nr:YncE family protein [Vicinamibacteria bacterium]
MQLRIDLIFMVAIGSVTFLWAQESVTPIAQEAIVTLDVPGFVDFLAPDGSAVWATNRGRVEKLESDQPAPVITVPVPNPCGAMEFGFGALWVADCQNTSLYRIDPQLARVTSVIPTGLADPRGELSIAVGAGSVWLLTDQAGILTRIDPQSNQIIARVHVAPYSYAAAFGFGSVWITNTGAPTAEGSGSVQRIDPASNTVVTTIPVGPTPRFLAAGEGAVWTLNQADGSVSRIDPSSNTIAATIPVDVAGPGGDIATGAGKVWVRAKKILLSVIDPSTNRVTERYGPPAGSGAVRVAGDLVWVTAHDIKTVWVLQR